MSICGCDASASPSSAPGPVRTWRMPGGAPAASNSSARSRPPVIGVSEAGFRPRCCRAPSAGATARMPRTSGKFQGVMTATTPTGMRWMMFSLPVFAEGRISPVARDASEAPSYSSFWPHGPRTGPCPGSSPSHERSGRRTRRRDPRAGAPPVEGAWRVPQSFGPPSRSGRRGPIRPPHRAPRGWPGPASRGSAPSPSRAPAESCRWRPRGTTRPRRACRPNGLLGLGLPSACLRGSPAGRVGRVDGVKRLP